MLLMAIYISHRRNIIKSACQIIDRGVNLYSPWSGNYNFWPTIKGMTNEMVSFLICVASKAGKYRDTGSAEPGSAAIFGSVSGSENHFLGIF